MQSWPATIFFDFAGDLVARVLKVHDCIRDFDSDGINNSFNIKRSNQSISQQSKLICKKRFKSLMLGK